MNKRTRQITVQLDASDLAELRDLTRLFENLGYAASVDRTRMTVSTSMPVFMLRELQEHLEG
ncbi:MAG: hypothetical protein H6716_24785 [Polyangiaceae bacterium]|nr:hypothetical protein [Polyangiaceae bacterium]